MYQPSYYQGRQMFVFFQRSRGAIYVYTFFGMANAGKHKTDAFWRR